MCAPSPPPAPDYTAAAKETAAGNLEAARAATQANRINQYTPYGSLTYTQKPVETIDYAGYNKALDDYNKSLAAYNAGTPAQPVGSVQNPFLSPEERDISAVPASGPRGPFSGVAPTLDQFKTVNPDAGWEQTMNLTPQAQAALDQQLALNQKFGETANAGFDSVRQLFENPGLDTSMLPARAIDVGKTAQEAIMSRLQPQLAQQEEALRARLANQGITLGSDAYGRENTIQGQRANDLMLQAALQGINLDQQNRASALQEQAYLQDRPLNLINALRTGNQVQNPQFQGFSNQTTTAGPDLLGANQAQYQAAISANNAAGAGMTGLLSGLTDVAGLGIKAGLFSDRRLKKNIKMVGKMENGLNVYSYEYVWGGPTQIGVMAQEVELVNPDAVFEVDGYKAVDYGKL